MQRQPLAHGTLIAGLRTPDRTLVLAADSRRVQFYMDGRTTTSDTACKMFEYRGYVWGAAGVAGDEGEFNPAQLAKDTIDAGGTLQQIAATYERELQGPLTKILRAYERLPNNPLQAVKGTVKGLAGVHYFFARPATPQPVLIWGNLGSDPPDTPVRHLQGAQWPEDHRTVMFLGHSEAVMRESRGRIGFRNTSDAMAVADGILRIAARDEATARYVGGPTDLVVINTSKILWIRQKAHCRA